jgi:hypothetical protein
MLIILDKFIGLVKTLIALIIKSSALKISWNAN